MHNLIPHSQLDGWQHNHFQSHDDMLDDYYECLIECDTQQNECKRICREILYWLQEGLTPSFFMV